MFFWHGRRARKFSINSEQRTVELCAHLSPVSGGNYNLADGRRCFYLSRRFFRALKPRRKHR